LIERFTVIECYQSGCWQNVLDQQLVVVFDVLRVCCWAWLTVAVVFKEDLITECTNTMLENIGW